MDKSSDGLAALTLEDFRVVLKLAEGGHGGEHVLLADNGVVGRRSLLVGELVIDGVVATMVVLGVVDEGGLAGPVGKFGEQWCKFGRRLG